jgi:hypothetical protein
MKKETVINVLQKRAKQFYGRDAQWLVSLMDKEMNDVGYTHEPIRVVEAYEVYQNGN